MTLLNCPPTLGIGKEILDSLTATGDAMRCPDDPPNYPIFHNNSEYCTMTVAYDAEMAKIVLHRMAPGCRRYRGEKTLNDKYGKVSGPVSAKHKKAARVPPIRAATRDKHIFTSLPQVGKLCAMAVSRALISINPAHGSAWELHRFTVNTSLDPAAAKSARRRPDWA